MKDETDMDRLQAALLDAPPDALDKRTRRLRLLRYLGISMVGVVCFMWYLL